MYLNKIFKTSAFFTIALFLFIPFSYGGNGHPDTDSARRPDLYSFFDLRDRESFVQVTNLDSSNSIIHIQIFDVSNNCNENNFFDTYTPSDTHVYNMRDILTNDGNPSGVVLPDGAYGVVVAIAVTSEGGPADFNANIFGNFRVIDDNGYEYRTNSPHFPSSTQFFNGFDPITFNFNSKAGVNLSDIIGIDVGSTTSGEVDISNIVVENITFDINILNNNEVIFSCRNIIFACTDQDNPLLEALLEDDGRANVASFEYGINNAIPHSKGGELLCPGNTIEEGIVEMTSLDGIQSTRYLGFAGLNNGNGRGSMDSWLFPNSSTFPSPPPG